jgi:hypothetical protein
LIQREFQPNDFEMQSMMCSKTNLQSNSKFGCAESSSGFSCEIENENFYDMKIDTYPKKPSPGLKSPFNEDCSDLNPFLGTKALCLEQRNLLVNCSYDFWNTEYIKVIYLTFVED